MKHFVLLSKRVAKKKKKKKHLKRKRKIHFSINTEIVEKGQETRRKMCIERKAKRQREEFINSRFYQTTRGQKSNIRSLAVKRSLKVKKNGTAEVGEKGEKCNRNDLGNDSELDLKLAVCYSRDLRIKVTHAFNGFSLFMACYGQSVNDHFLLSRVTSRWNWKRNFRPPELLTWEFF